MKKGLIGVILMIVATNIIGQDYELKSTVEIYSDIQELQRGLRVLYIAAHPDDENTRLISWLENDQHIETAYLSLTRGQGGQNLIGDEKGDGLGVIRTYELLEARKIDGGEQFFTRAIDFGYSKSAEESFEFWGKEEVLHDVVYVIRNFRPHVIITRFPPTRRAGHGHHEASALLAEEAFDLAVDPTAFPEQLDRLEPWQADAMYHNASSWWDKSLDDLNEEQLKEKGLHRLNVGTYNDLLGYNMNEIAAMARSKHRCQAFGTPRVRGSQIEYLQYIKGDKGAIPFGDMAGIWKQSPQHAEGLSKVIADFNFTDRSANLSLLQQHMFPLLAQRNMWADAKDMQIVNQRINDLKLDLSGIRVEVYADETPVVIGSEYEVTVEVFNSSNEEQTVDFKHSVIDTAVTVKAGESVEWKEKFKASQLPSNPFWLKNDHAGWLYGIDKKSEIGLPYKADEQIEYLIKVDRQFVMGSSTLHRKWNDRSIGEIVQPMLFVNPVSINPKASSIVVTKESKAMINVDVTANTDVTDVRLNVFLPDGWSTDYAMNSFSLKKGQQKNFSIEVLPSKDAVMGNVEFSVFIEGSDYVQTSSKIVYDHIPEIAMPDVALVKAVPLELNVTPNSKILYIEGSGDEVDEALVQMGYQVDNKSLLGMTLNELLTYKAIVTGIRAFNVNQDLASNLDLLNAYAMSGGNVIIQYNTTYDLKVDQIGPFKLVIGRDRVTDEFSKVTLIEPKHKMFNEPNALKSADWDGWVQERGLYFASEWDKSYVPLIEWNDKGEEPAKGGLLVTPFGKGSFTYTGISFFRQLPAGVPGAYRLFANMIEYTP